MLLETKRLIIRPLIETDFSALALLLGDPRVMRFSLCGPLNRERSWNYLQRMIAAQLSLGFSLYAVIEQQTEALIGIAGLLSQSIDGESYIELGYRFLPSHWKQGFGVEATTAICSYAFEELKLRELISIIDPQNEPSLKLAKRLGMCCWKETLFHDIPVHIYQIKNLFTISPVTAACF